MDSPGDTPKGVGCPIRTSEDHRALAPPLGFSQRATSFIASRYQGIHQMPFMCCARAQPRARVPWSVVRRQWSETSRHPLPDRSRAGTVRTRQPRPMRVASAARIPMLQVQPRPTSAMMGAMAGPASRSRLASRFQRSETDDRCQTAAGPVWTAPRHLQPSAI
jgi:hypothetical protein